MQLEDYLASHWASESGDADALANTQAATEHNQTVALGTVQTMTTTAPRGFHLSPVLSLVAAVALLYLLFGEFD